MADTNQEPLLSICEVAQRAELRTSHADPKAIAEVLERFFRG
jgi:hypothetical protein